MKLASIFVLAASVLCTLNSQAQGNLTNVSSYNTMDNAMAMANAPAQAFGNMHPNTANARPVAQGQVQQSNVNPVDVQQFNNDNSNISQNLDNNLSPMNSGNDQLLSGNQQASASGFRSFALPQLRMPSLGSSTSSLRQTHLVFRTRAIEKRMHRLLNQESSFLHKHKPRRKKPLINVAACWKP